MARRALGRAVSAVGVDCQFAGNAGEAMHWLESRTFSIVLVDLVMPGASGIELAQEIERLHPDVAVVLTTDAGDSSLSELAAHHGVFGVLHKPCKNEDVVSLLQGARRWKQREQQQLGRIRELEGALVQHSVENSRLADRLRRVQSGTYEGILLALAKAGSLKDDEPVAHLKRMSSYCTLIAEEIGMNQEECQRIRLASFTHDIGKIGIPEAILLKPSRLSPAEFSIMQEHTTQGFRILSSAATGLQQDDPSSSEVIGLAATIAHSHHERYDGSGYPRRLSGYRIPLEGRIALVADVFDAMTNDRVYRRALSVEDTVTFLVQQRGVMFDPRLVDAFTGQMPEVMAIKQQYSEDHEGFEGVGLEAR